MTLHTQKRNEEPHAHREVGWRAAALHAGNQYRLGQISSPRIGRCEAASQGAGVAAAYGAVTPSRRVVAQEGSSRSQSARSSGYTASCTEILQCSGVAATVLTANPPGLIRPALCDAGRQTD